jgi:hypothetical protein
MRGAARAHGMATGLPSKTGSHHVVLSCSEKPVLIDALSF